MVSREGRLSPLEKVLIGEPYLMERLMPVLGLRGWIEWLSMVLILR